MFITIQPNENILQKGRELYEKETGYGLANVPENSKYALAYALTQMGANEILALLDQFQNGTKIYRQTSWDKEIDGNEFFVPLDLKIRGYLHAPTDFKIKKVTAIAYNGWKDTVATEGITAKGNVFKLSCLSSEAVGMGNCQCYNHDVWQIIK
jgi:hypothetical protein